MPRSASELPTDEARGAPRVPFVTVIVPCRNERRYIVAALRSLLDGSYPASAMEVLLVDGRSTDGTRALAARLAAADPRLRVVDNPRRTTPAALNRGLDAARGEIVVRADAHARYPRDYLAVLVRTLEASGADLVGCPADALAGGHGWVARVIALACSSRFATASPFRAHATSGAADTVPFGCWRRALFDRVGRFDERLLRNQDNEHASRILRAGGRVHLTCETRVGSIVRGSLGELLRHAATSGMWNAFTQRLYPYTFRWRHFLPGLFFAGALTCLALIACGILSHHPLAAVVGAALLGPYVLANLVASVARAGRRLALFAPIAFVLFSFHVSYGYGVAKGWLLVALGAWRKHLGAPGGEASGAS
jgi:glycosyltransferase involved in cell wall biosynthesis